jgi:hypothetical protein
VNESPDCTVCSRQLWEDEIGRFACKPCERRTGDDLAALAGPGGLYARLCLRIHPASRGAGQAVSGSRTASIPASLEILNLTANGGVVSTLELWVEDWATYGLATVGTGGRLQYRVDRAVATLRLNLPRAVERHPAFDECADEIGQLKRQAEGIVNGGKEAIPFRVQCGCGATIKATLQTQGETCRKCAAEYTRMQVLRTLPLVERSAA